MTTLTANSLELLLLRLDADTSQAAEKYEELRLKLTKFFTWQGCAESNADILADVAIDRVSEKIAQGVEIKSMNAYAREISRFVWLEYLRKNKEEGVEELPEVAVNPVELDDGEDLRLACLRSCLGEVTSDTKDRELILGYYNASEGAKNKDWRKLLAEKSGLTMNALKVKASRLRDRLEKCINECVRRKMHPVTK